MNILVFDTGTSSMRGILYDAHAQVLHSRQIEYRVLYPAQNRAEQDPADWKNALYTIAADITAFAFANGLSVDGLSLTAQRSSVIPVDHTGEPLHNAIMWLDTRNREICTALAPHEAAIIEKTGARINAVFSGSRMSWIKQNEPEIYRKTKKMLTIADYLAWLITGEYRTDHTYGSRSSLMNIRTRSWDNELLRLFEIDRDKLCTLIAPGAIHGQTSAAFSQATGLPQGIPLISAGGDQQCAALGLGAVREGDLELTAGTGAFLLAPCTQVPEQLGGEIICGAHAATGQYVLEASMLACASLYNWVRDQFYPGSNQYAQINADAAASPPGSNGCYVLPYFQGRGTPDWNSTATGEICGLTLNTTRADIVRAVLEAIAFETRNNIELLEQHTGAIKTLYVSGGLTNFALFNQLLADVCQKTLVKSETAEQTSLGGFISAAVTLGLYPDYPQALATVKHTEKTTRFQPNPAQQMLYERCRAAMNAHYSNLKKG